MIYISPHISLAEKEIKESYIHASGPGGQNINKVATAVQIRFNIQASSSLPAEVKKRLLFLGGKRVNKDGVLVIDARRFRKLEANRQDARQRLIKLILQAAKKPKPRIKTEPTAQSKIKRLAAKRRRSEKKARRRQVIDREE